MGQVGFILAHPVMQISWKICFYEQCRGTIFSSSTKFWKHIAHSLQLVMDYSVAVSAFGNSTFSDFLQKHKYIPTTNRISGNKHIITRIANNLGLSIT